jgi:hypothetical protein
LFLLAGIAYPVTRLLGSNHYRPTTNSKIYSDGIATAL